MAQPRIQLVKGAGVVGDRWYRPRWLYPLRWLNAKRKGRKVGVTSVSIISLADIARANAELGRSFTPTEMRRNIVVDGDIDLNALVGVRFAIGGVILRGDNLCTPCSIPPLRAGRKGEAAAFLKAFGHEKFGGVNRGGLRAEILSGGFVRVGDKVKTPAVQKESWGVFGCNV